MTRGNTVLAQGAGLNYLLPQWSPPLKDGSTGDEAGELILQLRAAMEPAVEQREHLAGRGQDDRRLPTAMEPAVERREHNEPYRLQLKLYVPQWSPLVTAGAPWRW